MTEAKLREIEERGGLESGVRCHDVPALCDEVRACWAAINDLRQDSTAYRRAIVDVVRLLGGIIGNVVLNKDDWVVRIADLALTEDEFRRVWEGEPAPLGVVYDVDEGTGGDCLDAETGEHIRYVKRANPEAGWYEAFDTDERGTLVMPLTLRRHWRNIRVKSYEPKVMA